VSALFCRYFVVNIASQHTCLCRLSRQNCFDAVDNSFIAVTLVGLRFPIFPFFPYSIFDVPRCWGCSISNILRPGPLSLAILPQVGAMSILAMVSATAGEETASSA